MAIVECCMAIVECFDVTVISWHSSEFNATSNFAVVTEVSVSN